MSEFELWPSWRVGRVRVRPLKMISATTAAGRLEWYPTGHRGRKAVKRVRGTRAQLDAAAHQVVADGLPVPASWSKKKPSKPTLGDGLQTIGHLLRAWLYQIEQGGEGAHLSPKTRTLYRQAARRVLYQGPGEGLYDVLIARFDDRAALAWSRGRAPLISSSGYNHDRTVLTLAWEWAARERHIPALPCPMRGVRYPARYGGTRHARRTPTAQEVAATLAAAPDTPAAWRYTRVLRILWSTGARAGEVFALTRGDIDLAPTGQAPHGWVHLQGAVPGERTGKGRGASYRRRVPLTADAREALLDVINQGDTPLQPGDRLWPGPVDSWVSRLCAASKSYCDRAGIPRWTPHGLRRLAVDTMRRGGVDVATAAKITGHSVTTMLTKYATVDDDDRVRAVLLLAKLGQ